MKNLFVIIFLISVSTIFGQNKNQIHSTSDFNLKDKIDFISVTLVKKVSIQTKGRKKQTIVTFDTIQAASFNFTQDGYLQDEIDSNFNLIRVISRLKLDTTKFIIQYDTICKCEVANKIMNDSNEYEVHFRKFNNQELLISDSTVNRKLYEIYHEGPKVDKFTYDIHGNVIYYWMKSSFVFYLIHNRYFVYVYDEKGNWIEKREYVLPVAYQAYTEFEFDIENKTPQYITYREIHYY